MADIQGILTVVVPAVVAVLTVILSDRVKAKGEASKLDAEAQEAVSRAADTIIQNLLTEIERLTARVKRYQAELDLARSTADELRANLQIMERQANDYLNGIKLLTHQIRSMGAEPVYKPKVE